MKCRQVELARLPDGDIAADNFCIVDAEAPDAGPGQARVRLRHLGLNAGLAHRIGGGGTAYGPAIGVGDVPASDAVVEIIDTDDDGFQAGDLAVCTAPWSTISVHDLNDLRPSPSARSGSSPANDLTVLGHVGLTAYTGLVHVGEVTAADTVYVSAAAGGVGSCVVQFAKASGATVIGLAGSPGKVAMLTDELGADAAIDRHDGDALELLKGAAPDGIDLYFDSVGGEHLEAAIAWLNPGGRVVVCGAASQGSNPGGPSNYRRMIYQELSMRGFSVTNHQDLRDEFESTVGGWIDAGLVRSVHTTFDGFDRIPDAFESLLTGGSTGRVVVAVDADHD